MGCLVGAAVGGGPSAGSGRTTFEAPLLGIGDSAGDQLRGNTVWHVRQGRSSGEFSGWCEWWCRRRRSLPAGAVGDSSKGSPDIRGNVGELRSDRCRDKLSIGPSFSVIRLLRTNARTYRTFTFASTLVTHGSAVRVGNQPLRAGGVRRNRLPPVGASAPGSAPGPRTPAGSPVAVWHIAANARAAGRRCPASRAGLQTRCRVVVGLD